MAVERSPSGSSLIDVLDRVLDKGIVIDAWVRVSLVGIDLVTVEARIVVASIDTYLKYSEAVGITAPSARPRELGAGDTEPERPPGAPGSPPLAGERLAELLSAVAEAPDFATAASFLLAQLAEVGGAQRGSLLALDGQRELLVTVATLGFPEGEAPRQRVPIDDHGHPLVLAALSLTPVCGDGRGPTRLGFPFATWIALPLAQPQFRGAPPVLSERRRRVGHAPLGVALLEGLPAGDAAPSLAYAAMLAGPVLSRLWVVDELRQSAQRLDQQRDLLTALLNSLPDPIVITNAANDMVVQNRRAEHLFAFGDADSEGRRRAVEINNLLFTSFLARAVMGGADSGARELNLVDPDEGTDLLF